MGYAAVVWFDKGERITTDRLNRLARQLTSYLVDCLARFFKRKPGGKDLKEFMSEALESSPLAYDGSDPANDPSAPDGINPP
jgi:hypothetical protein